MVLVDKNNASVDTLKTALKGYASGIALLMGHTDVDHVTMFVIRDEDERATSFNVMGWCDEEKVIDCYEVLED